MGRVIIASAVLFEASCGGDPEPGDMPMGGEPIGDTTPFGRHLEGSALLPKLNDDSLERARDVRFAADIYFPSGRVAGGEVVIAFPSHYPRTGMLIARATLDEDLGASGMRIEGDSPEAYYESFEVTMDVALLPGDGFVQLTVETINLAVTDAGQLYMGTVYLAPTGDAPEPRLHPWIAQSSIAPSATSWLTASVPVGGGISSLRALADGTETPVDVAEMDGRVSVTSRAAFPPNRELTFDASGVTDVLGRPFVVAELQQLRTTDVVSPGSFEDAPTGAVVGSFGSAGAGRDEPFWGLAALAPSDAERVRLTAEVNCRYRSGNPIVVHLVAEDGQSELVPLDCSDCDGCTSPSVAEVRRPGAGVSWISVAYDTPGLKPQWGPPTGGPFLVLRSYEHLSR